MNAEWIWGKQMRTTSKGHKLKTVQGLELVAKSETLLCLAFQTSLLTKTEADLEPGMELNLGWVSNRRCEPKVQGQSGQKMGQIVPGGKTGWGGAEGKGHGEQQQAQEGKQSTKPPPSSAVLVWLLLRSPVLGSDERPDLLPVAFGQVDLRRAARMYHAAWNTCETLGAGRGEQETLK